MHRIRARTLARAVEALRTRGEGFPMPLTTPRGKQIEAEGRAIGGRAVLRLREVERHRAAACGTDHRAPHCTATSRRSAS